MVTPCHFLSCTVVLIIAGACLALPATQNAYIAAVCTQANIAAQAFYHTYPPDSHSFIQCNEHGRGWVMPCAPGTAWDQSVLICDHAPAPVTTPSQPCNSPNDADYIAAACTPANIAAHRFYHPYSPNPYNFIQCDAFGNGWVMPCGPGTIWDQDALTCNHDTTGGNPGGSPGNPGTAPSITSPPSSGNLIAAVCTPDNIAVHKFYHPYPLDAYKFIQCDAHGNGWVMPCGPRTIWDQSVLTCNHDPSGLVPAPPSNPCGVTTSADYIGAVCTEANIAAERFYHPYPPSRHGFIQCDAHGNGWVMPCGPGTAWDQVAYTCNHDN